MMGAPAQQQGFFDPLATAPAQPANPALLDQMLSPIALYPDELLANVLAASTYPLEVIALHRWLESQPSLSGDALAAAVAAQPWDDSVKALAAFRPVVAMMNGQLEWMQSLGNAYLASEADVMDSVQRLRRKAREAGTLQENANERVVDDGTFVAIEPATPEVVYVPTYDPRVAYGPWWWPEYPPYYWGYYYGPWDYVWGGIGFVAISAGGYWYGHSHVDWHGHHVDVHHPGGGSEPWHHSPPHRGGVPYGDARTADRYHGTDRGHQQSRQDFRGFDVHPNPSQGTPTYRANNPAARPTGPSPLGPVPRESVGSQSQRGHQSLSRPSAPSSRSSAPPARSSGAPSGGGHSRGK